MYLLDLTIAIPVRNEEKNLAGCLQAIGNDFAKKIVIIDSGSTDLTKQIAIDFDVEVIDFNWDGHFPKKRNWFLRNHSPVTKWVLFLDADEYLTPEFKEEVRTALHSTSHSGFWLDFSIYFLGKKLKGGYPLLKLALFKIGAGEYEKIEEANWSKLDMEIHEHPILNGTTGKIKSKIDHLDFRGVGQYMNKHVEYASWEANRYIEKMNDPSFKNTLIFRQKLKYGLMKSVWVGPLYFLGSFFFLGGFRDGARGFAFAILKAAYFTTVYCKIRELTNWTHK